MLSIPHLIIIFIVALVVFGPEKLPELARNLGKVMAEFRKHTGDLRSTLENHMRDLERETEQRKIGGGPAASTAAEPATSPAPPMTPAVGAVPATPPQSTIDSPALSEPANGEASTAAVAQTPAAEKQENPSDAGNRPA
jgi:sec-independent protein translocase protein TatB